MASDRTTIIYRQIDTPIARELGVFKYCTGDHAPSEFFNVRNRAAEAFEAESIRALTLESDTGTPRRIESVRPLIIKILTYIGFLPTKQIKSIVAKVIELLAVDPEVDLDRYYAIAAERSGTDMETIKKTVERAFDPFDPELTAKVARLTGTEPFTSRDIIYDLSLYVRKKYIGGCVNA